MGFRIEDAALAVCLSVSSVSRLRAARRLVPACSFAAGDGPFRYWPRLAVGLLTSAVLTVLTLPERSSWPCGWSARGRPSPQAARPRRYSRYYRSGTTFLQFLHELRPRTSIRRLEPVLQPAGFWLSWTFLRFFLTRFVRVPPADDLAFGPDVPGEDELRPLQRRLASSLVGRHVLPRLRDFYDRFHDLKNLTPASATLASLSARLRAQTRVLAGGRGCCSRRRANTARVRGTARLVRGDGRRAFRPHQPRPAGRGPFHLGLHRSLTLCVTCKIRFPRRNRNAAPSPSTWRRTVFPGGESRIPPGRLA